MTSEFLLSLIKTGNYRIDGIKSFENPVPTIIETADRNLLVYQFTPSPIKSDSEQQKNSQDEFIPPYPTVYFYDYEIQKDVAKASGATLFLHNTNDNLTKKTKVYLYCDLIVARFYEKIE